MLAYVELVQRKEKEIGCDVLTHQKWYVLLIYSDAFSADSTSTGAGQTTSTRLFKACRLDLLARLQSARIRPKTRSSRTICSASVDLAYEAVCRVYDAFRRS